MDVLGLDTSTLELGHQKRSIESSPFSFQIVNEVYPLLDSSTASFEAHLIKEGRSSSEKIEKQYLDVIGPILCDAWLRSFQVIFHCTFSNFWIVNEFCTHHDQNTFRIIWEWERFKLCGWDLCAWLFTASRKEWTRRQNLIILRENYRRRGIKYSNLFKNAPLK